MHGAVHILNSNNPTVLYTFRGICSLPDVNLRNAEQTGNLSLTITATQQPSPVADLGLPRTGLSCSVTELENQFLSQTCLLSRDSRQQVWLSTLKPEKAMHTSVAYASAPVVSDASHPACVLACILQWFLP